MLESPSPEFIKNCGDVALGDGLGLDLVMLEVFSNLRDSMISALTSASYRQQGAL